MNKKFKNDIKLIKAILAEKIKPLLEKIKPIIKKIMLLIKFINFDKIYKVVVVILLLLILSTLNKMYRYGNYDISGDIYDIKDMVKSIYFIMK